MLVPAQVTAFLLLASVISPYISRKPVFLIPVFVEFRQGIFRI